MCNEMLTGRGLGRTCIKPTGHAGRHQSAAARDKRLAAFRQYRRENIEYFREHDRRRAGTPHRRKVQRNSSLQRRYSITLDDYNTMLKAQNGRCAICDTKEPGGKDNRFGVDHDHETGKVRGLLCNHCNMMVGLAEDNPDILYNAAIYLEENSG